MTKGAPDPKALAGLYASLQQAAALQDGFRPANLLRAATHGSVPDDDVLVAAALSALREDCSVSRDSGGQVWTLRASVRRKVAVDSGADAYSGSGESEIEHALAGAMGYQPKAIARLVTYASGTRPPPAAVLARRLVALERAGPKAPAYPLQVALRGALNAAEQRERAAALLAGGVFGRDRERTMLRDWIASPFSAPPVRAMHVSGLPGIGKSFLLQSVVHEARNSSARPLVIWLDFDRSGLQVADATAFFEEVSRQVGDALPTAADDLRVARLQAARERSALSSREAALALPRELLARMGALVQAQRRPVLVVLDTLEVLRARAETAVATLFEHLDRLVSVGLAPMSVVSAGRGDALDPVPDRAGPKVHLSGLEPEYAQAYLQTQNVPDAAQPAILAQAAGNPLLLKLSARAFADGVTLAPDNGQVAEVAGAYLYRSILSRLEPPLNDLAHAGLVLRRVQPSLLRLVLAPALGLDLSEDRAQTLFQELATQHWLVEAEPGGMWLRHRADTRAAFLPLLYSDRPDLAIKVNQRAVEALADDPEAVLYHQLQLSAFTGQMPLIDPAIAARFNAVTIDELPLAVRDAVRRARGERSDMFRQVGTAQTTSAMSPDEDELLRLVELEAKDLLPGYGADVISMAAADAEPSATPAKPAPSFVLLPETGRLLPAPAGQTRPLDPRAIEDLRLMLASGERREATFILERAIVSPFLASDPGALVVLAYLWLSGAWASAFRLWRAIGAPYDDKEPFIARILRELDAEARFSTAVARLPDLAPPPASGRSALLGSSYDVALALLGDDRIKTARTPAEGEARAAGILAPWLDTLSRSHTARLAAEAEVRFERLGLQLATDLPKPRQDAAKLVVAIPHLVPMAALCSDRGGQRRADWLGNLRTRLPDILQLQVPWIQGAPAALAKFGDSPFDMLDLLAGAGVLADAMRAMSLTLQDKDVSQMAASAERWRRLSQGMWSLSRRAPKGWRCPDGADATTLDLLSRLQATPGTARRLFDLWLPEPAAQTRCAQKLRGVPARITFLPERLAALMQKGLPAGLAAAIAADEALYRKMMD